MYNILQCDITDTVETVNGVDHRTEARPQATYRLITVDEGARNANGDTHIFSHVQISHQLTHESYVGGKA